MERFFPSKSSPSLLDNEGQKNSNKPVESKLRMVVSSGDFSSDLLVGL